MHLAISFNKPIETIITVKQKQAYERCGITSSNKPNKGLEAAKAILSIFKNGTKKI